MKLHDISITPSMVKEVIPNLDPSKASDPDYGVCSKEVGFSGGSKEF